MKHQVLFSLKDKNKKIKVSSAAILLGSYERVKKHQTLFSSKDKSKKIKVSSAAVLLGSLKGIREMDGKKERQ